MRRRGSCKNQGFTLVELLLVITLLSVFAGAMIPRLESSNVEQIEGAAQVLVADLSYAQNLAVTYGSKYKLTFDLSQNRYVLRHSGTNSQLDTLPFSPYKSPGDSATEQSTDFDELPHLGQAARIVAVQKLTPAAVNVSDVEFGPLGETTRPQETVIWFTCGKGSDRAYISVTIDPVTGLTSVSEIHSTPPPNGT